MKKDLRPADKVNILFCFFLTVLTFFFYRNIHSAGYLILIYSSMILFQVALAYIYRYNSILTNIRDIIFPVVSIFTIFETLELIVHNVNPQDIDYLLIRLDYMIFGFHPTVALENYMSPLLTDIIQVAYSTYYFLPISLGIALKLKGKHEEFEKSLFLIMLCFYISYLGYILFPALGPRYAMHHFHQGELEGLILAMPLHNLLNHLEGIKRNAFPSGHTGIALLVLFLSYIYARRLFWVLLIPILLLIIATVYCRYHYVVDVIGGIVLTVVTIIIGEVYYNNYLKKGNVKSFMKKYLLSV